MLVTFVAGLSLATPLAAQRLPKPEFTRTPTVLVAPSYIQVSSTNRFVTPHLSIEWNAVANAVEYRVSRSADGGPETDIFQGPIAAFVYQGFQDCTPAARIPGHLCVYFDRNVMPSVYYTYRVRTIYSGGVASPPSGSSTGQRPQP
jgi:hypothetical protein